MKMSDSTGATAAEARVTWLQWERQSGFLDDLGSASS